MSGIFLSHYSEDKALAEEIDRQIQNELGDIHVFVSSKPDAIPSSKEWFDSVIADLSKADVLVLLITPLSETRPWVAFEYGYFWKQKKGQHIHILSHPKAQLVSPFNRLQAKLVTDPKELHNFFTELCKGFGHPYQGQADIEAIVRTAESLPIESSEDRKLKASLILQMGSEDNATVLNAVRELREREWLTDGSLRGKTFTEANLQNAKLQKADLQGAKLNWAKLQSVDFTEAQLQGANLGGAHFERASDAPRAATLWYANLEGAILGSATMWGVNLGGANLKGADLTGATLTGVQTDNTQFDEGTILPDGNKWSHPGDIERFTSPSDWVAFVEW